VKQDGKCARYLDMVEVGDSNSLVPTI